MYEKGEGVDEDLSQAGKWYDLAAQSGDANAQNRIGDLAYVTKEYETAFQWYLKAAKQGNADAQRVQ